VREGQTVARGEPIALSGYSGLDALVTFPFGTPHVHFNTWLDGEPVDPFPHEGQASLWRAGDLPRPMREPVAEERFEPSDYSEAGVAAAIAACKTASSRRELAAAEPLSARAGRLLVEMNYYPTRFPERPFIYTQRHARTPRLDLPFPADAFDGVVFVDDLPTPGAA
jgi:murein DD-endopeptidase